MVMKQNYEFDYFWKLSFHELLTVTVIDFPPQELWNLSQA
jgi:hypothetical protein